MSNRNERYAHYDVRKNFPSHAIITCVFNQRPRKIKPKSEKAGHKRKPLE